MSKTRKLVFGTLAIALVATGVGMPGISGYVLEQKINRELDTAADRFGFSVSSVNVDRHFGESTIAITLKGKGLRKLSQESAAITGTLSHSGLFDLPTLVTGNLQLQYSIDSAGTPITIPANISGEISWSGLVDATLKTQQLEFPLDPAGTMTASMAPVTWTIATDTSGPENQLNVNASELKWLFSDQSSSLLYQVAPSTLTISPTGDTWSMAIPEARFSAIHDDASTPINLFSLSDIHLTSVITTDKDLLSGQYSVDTGPLMMPLLSEFNADQLIKGISITSSFDNFSRSSLASFMELAQEAAQLEAESLSSPHSQTAIKTALIRAVQTLSKGSPRMALDDFTLKTVNGDLSVSLDLESSDKLSDALEPLITSTDFTSYEKQQLSEQLMAAISSSASVRLTDDIIEWGCQQLGNSMAIEQGATPSEGEIMGNMCKSLADSGDFLMMPCMDITNPQQQQQCVTDMKQVQTVWTEKKELTLAMKEGQLYLNGAVISFPIPI